MITGVIVTDEWVAATHLQRACWAALSFASSHRRSHRHYSQIKGLLSVGKWHSALGLKSALYREKPPSQRLSYAGCVSLTYYQNSHDAEWGALPAVLDYCAYILWGKFCANCCYLVGAAQPVTERACVCSHPHFCEVPFCAGFAHHAGASCQRGLTCARKTSSSIRNKHALGAVLGVGLSVSPGLKLPNLAASLLSCHNVGIIFVSTLASSDDSNHANNFEIIRWESLEWSKALLPCGQTLCKALNSLPSLFPALLWERTLSFS